MATRKESPEEKTNVGSERLTQMEIDVGWAVFLARRSIKPKVSQGWLATEINKRLGLNWDQTDVSELEAGKRHIRVGMIPVLAEILSRPQSWFYEEAANYRLVPPVGKVSGLPQTTGQAASKDRKRSKKPGRTTQLKGDGESLLSQYLKVA